MDEMIMFLIKKGKIKSICAEYSLKYKLDNGWKLVKPMFDIPRSIKYLQIKNRDTEKIKWWYLDKIEQLTKRLEQYKSDLKKFEEMVQ